MGDNHPDDCAVLSSSTRPYNAFKRSDWLNDCMKLLNYLRSENLDEAEMHDEDYSEILILATDLPLKECFTAFLGHRN